MKTTIVNAADKPSYSAGSLWVDSDGQVFVLVRGQGDKHEALDVDNLWLSYRGRYDCASDAVYGLSPFHGKVTIELGAGT